VEGSFEKRSKRGGRREPGQPDIDVPGNRRRGARGEPVRAVPISVAQRSVLSSGLLDRY